MMFKARRLADRLCVCSFIARNPFTAACKNFQNLAGPQTIMGPPGASRGEMGTFFRGAGRGARSHAYSPDLCYFLDRDLPFDEGIGTFVVPVRSGGHVKSFECTARRIREGRRIVEQDSLTFDMLS